MQWNGTAFLYFSSNLLTNELQMTEISELANLLECDMGVAKFGCPVRSLDLQLPPGYPVDLHTYKIEKVGELHSQLGHQYIIWVRLLNHY